MSDEALDIGQAVHALVDEYRSQCLWFLRPDYYPDTLEATLRVLAYIQRHGDVAAHVRAGQLREWLSRTSSAASAAS